MDSSFFEFVGSPLRSNSAPPQLDSSTLFAFPVDPMQFEYADVAAGQKTQNKRATSTGNISRLELSKVRSFETTSTEVGSESDESPRSKCASSLVNEVIADFITGEDSPPLIYSEAYSAPPPFSLFDSNLVELSGRVSNFFIDQMTHDDFSLMLSQAYVMAKDHVGCRHLQRKLEEEDSYVTSALLNTLRPHLLELMVDPFGNYLCQKLIEVGEPAHLSIILDVCQSSLADLALDPHGTRVVQRMVEVAGNTVFQDKLVEGLKMHVPELIKDINGNHVIQRCLHVMGAPTNQFIYDAACRSLVEISTHRNGCCVLQRCIDAADDSQRRTLVECIIKNAVDLVQDAFGNYVVQYVLDLNLEAPNAQLASTFIDHMLDLARQKFSSNVIEKCLQLNPPAVQLRMIEAIGSPPNIGLMLGDSYANYGKS
jgi:hypothetical protein